MIKKIIKISWVLILSCIMLCGINSFNILAEENDDDDWIGVFIEFDRDREIGVVYSFEDDENIKKRRDNPNDM